METLPPNTVHVWWVDLDAAQPGDLPDVLSAAERERAARFRFATDARRWTVSRKTLRLLLARYTDTSPTALAFVYSPQGKPALQPPDLNFLCFSLSHSQGRACIAVSRDREIGVDTEQIRTDLAPQELAESCFSPVEREALSQTSRSEQFALFFQIWTGKEAYVKARGQGLSFPLTQLTVLPPAADDTMRVRDESPKSVSLPPIHVSVLPAFSGFSASLAVQGAADYKTVTRDWNHRFPTTS